ncbi:MAG: PepSY domain-containing protein [Flavobacteriaceae bacterium]|nr:PepSY domain-containing protein [Flavobacteriaceae bacterium]
MKRNNNLSMTARTWHRNLGFFLAGIMMIYALSGIVLIFRKTDTFKIKETQKLQLEANLDANALGKALKIKRFKIDSLQANIAYFESGTYNLQTGEAIHTTKRYPLILGKLIDLHKATTSSPLYYLNIFFGLALLFFAISAFVMYPIKTPLFKKGAYFAVGGLVLAIIMLLL